MEAPIDLMLTDVVLPDGMNGPEIARQARRLMPSLKVAYMSGYTGDVLKRHDDFADGSILIQKPFAPEDLGRRIRQALDGKASRTA